MRRGNLAGSIITASTSCSAQLMERAEFLAKRANASKAQDGYQDGYGLIAPLDAQGFLDVTSMCCPMEMERFFNRLLEARGYYVCSKPHIQGLMHWFACMPQMEFQYVLDIIANGNPCKFWAPIGQSCPDLVGGLPDCGGSWCGNRGPTAPPPPAPSPCPACVQ